MATDPLAIPTRLRLNAWTGGRSGVSGRVAEEATGWAVRRRLQRMDRRLLAAEPADPRDWRDPRVGWGLVLPDRDGLSDAELATAADAPGPIGDLVRDRAGAPVLRYRHGEYTSLRRYYPDRPCRPLSLAGSEFGTGDDRLPRYLLIYGSPAEIPWDLQYALNARFAVGRLSLTGQPLANYIAALLRGWPQPSSSPFRAIVWATDHGPKDMSATMKRTVATPIATALQLDPDIGAAALFLRRQGAGATAETLRRAIAETRPGLIVTTSHGKAGDEGGAPTTPEDLGLPVGEDGSLVRPGDLLADWQPDGAIWYAHACCSAGSSGDTIFDGLFGADTTVGRLLASVAGLDSLVAPLPQALLGHERPLRAFIGHVEPTFDWTIAAPATGQPLAAGVRAGVYDGLYDSTGAQPVGLSFNAYYEPIGVLAAQQETLRRAMDRGTDVGSQALATQLSARDRMSTVILGDPTVVFDLSGAASLHPPVV